jgi:protein TonB
MNPQPHRSPLNPEAVMKRQFGLPAAFALTLLAFLFFGFTKTHRLLPPLPGKESSVDYSLPLVLPPEMREADEGSSASSPGTPRPRQDEKFNPVEQDSFPIEPMPRPPMVNHAQAESPLIGVESSDGCGCGVPIGMPGAPVDASLLDNPPQTRVQTAPAYPPNARATGLGGEVWVEFAVDESGRVLHPRVVRSNDPIFDEPTLRAVAKWRFEPGRKSGRPVSFRMIVPVTYRLE